MLHQYTNIMQILSVQNLNLKIQMQEMACKPFVSVMSFVKVIMINDWIVEW